MLCKRFLYSCKKRHVIFTQRQKESWNFFNCRAQDHPCSVVIKPTKGDFLNDYQNRNNLHIGITNSKGFVLEYDSKGLHRDRTLNWNQCIVVNLNSAIDPDVASDPDWPEYWDSCLEQVAQQNLTWTLDRYDSQEHNCFAFVLAFLRSIKQNPLSLHANNKVDFCAHYVLPKTTLAGKYICLYRKIKNNAGIYVTSKNKWISTITSLNTIKQFFSRCDKVDHKCKAVPYIAYTILWDGRAGSRPANTMLLLSFYHNTHILTDTRMHLIARALSSSFFVDFSRELTLR